MKTSDFAIETVNLTKEFKGSASPALTDVNIRVGKGESFCLVGPNGAGKTTLIKILCCLIEPTRGSASVAGCDILCDERKVKASIGLINGDERSFYWRLTGRQNLDFFSGLYDIPRPQARIRINQLIEFLQINEADRRFCEYSTGIKQRFSIARGLLCDPQILFMDEPTKGLDPPSAHALRLFIMDKLVRQQKKTVFFATHNLEDANEMAERVAFINAGQVKAVRAMEELRGRFSCLKSDMRELFRWFDSGGLIQDDA